MYRAYYRDCYLRIHNDQKLIIQKDTLFLCKKNVVSYSKLGKKKYKTIIGKNVFIGSDTQLVAPVKIEDDVLIAAGTTVTSDVPKGSLAISRTKQENKKELFYKFFRSE